MICYVLAMGKQHLGPHVVVGYALHTVAEPAALAAVIKLTVLRKRHNNSLFRRS